MRRQSAALTAVLGTVALAVSWRAGTAVAATDAAQPAGVEVVTPVQDTTPAAAPTSATAGTSPTSTGRTPTAKPKAQTVTTRRIRGALVRTPYGNVQVRATVRGTKLLDVVAVHLTDANDNSRSISAAAAPVLRREALTAGSARIDTVSGASYTSAGYRASLQAALDAAAR